MPIPRVLRSEIAVVRSDPHFPAYGGTMLTPSQYDSVISSQSGLYYDYFKLYEDIERDAHAFAVLQSRKMNVTHREWMVQPASESRADKKLAEMVDAQLKNLSIHTQDDEGNEAVVTLSSGFDNTCYGLLGALLNGVSYGEIMWGQDGREIYPEEIRIRKPRRFGYVLGEKGYKLRLLTRENAIEGEPLPPRKFIVHHHQPEYGPYGLGLGHRLYWPTFFKREDVKFWLLFVDKFAAPTAIGKYPRNASEAEKEILLDALDAIATETGLAVPEDQVVELLEAQRSGTVSCYEGLARWCDEQISEAVLGQTGTTNQSGGGGSRARDEVADMVSTKLAKYDADMLSESLNKTLIRWIAQFNSPSAGTPTVWRLFPELEEVEDLNARATRDKTIVDMMGRKPTEKYIAETYEIELEEPEPEQPDPLQQLFGGEGEAPAEGEQPTEQPTDEASTPVPAEEEPAEEPAELAEGRKQDAADDYTDRAVRQIRPTLEEWNRQLQAAVDEAQGYADLQERLLGLFPELNDADFAEVLGQAIATAELAGRYEVIAEESVTAGPEDLEEFARAIAVLQQMDLGEIDFLNFYDPQQPRDNKGRFAQKSSVSSGSKKKKIVEKEIKEFLGDPASRKYGLLNHYENGEWVDSGSYEQLKQEYGESAAQEAVRQLIEKRVSARIKEEETRSAIKQEKLRIAKGTDKEKRELSAYERLYLDESKRMTLAQWKTENPEAATSLLEQYDQELERDRKFSLDNLMETGRSQTRELRQKLQVAQELEKIDIVDEFMKDLAKESGIGDSQAAAWLNKIQIDAAISGSEINSLIVKSSARDFVKLCSPSAVQTLDQFVQSDSRAYASQNDKLINVGSSPVKSIVYHELGHHIEYTEPRIKKAAAEWRDNKASSSIPQKLRDLVSGSEYDSNEIALPGNFINPYVGKLYPNGATEVVSVGIQHFASSRYLIDFIEKDPDHFDFIVGIIKETQNDSI